MPCLQDSNTSRRSGDTHVYIQHALLTRLKYKSLVREHTHTRAQNMLCLKLLARKHIYMYTTTRNASLRTYTTATYQPWSYNYCSTLIFLHHFDILIQQHLLKLLSFIQSCLLNRKCRVLLYVSFCLPTSTPPSFRCHHHIIYRYVWGPYDSTNWKLQIYLALTSCTILSRMYTIIDKY